MSQNGGDFDFIIKADTVSLPIDPQFWDYLFSASLIGGWNLIVYEQDWLFTAVERLPALQVAIYVVYINYKQL